MHVLQSSLQTQTKQGPSHKASYGRQEVSLQ
ncbi:hypothetical protein CIB84_002960 [Bambusicola thoracicus]|uniref:Uncharacterized protein n=1 Tax=Bambusicola thoracicus TaxID=9083 RepID=A0A2P4TA98_BAMTH|nr:hypothetical protein CIB84_002960 [Bambusicola thoracicus]